MINKFTFILLVFVLAVTATSFAEEGGGSLWPVPDYKGDIWKRPALTGDWGGARTNMADKGVTLSVNNVTTFQSVIDGGKDEGSEIGGSLDYELHMDFQKMGLWPGAFVRLYGETQYGNFINSRTGAALAANLDGVLPLVDEDKIEIFVELKDTYYPGNYYTLTYNQEADRLIGVYHHLGINQKFDVYFTRKQIKENIKS
jgi:hypothetical protein